MFDRHNGDPQRTMNGRALGLGVLLGAVIGAGTALLLAPASGDDTRRVLRRNARRLAARTGETIGDAWEDADDAARRLARRGAKVGRKAASRVQVRLRDTVPW